MRKCLMECKTAIEAVALIRCLPFDASSCLTFSDATGVCKAAEISPKGVFVLEPKKGMLCHTNHFIANPSLGKTPELNSIKRYERGTSLLREKVSVFEILKDRLEDDKESHICKHNNDNPVSVTSHGTIACGIFDSANRTVIFTSKICDNQKHQKFSFPNSKL